MAKLKLKKKEKAKIILKQLNKLYPKTPSPLTHRNNFTLLVSVLLSAQCTDLNVNNVTKDIYPKYYKPEHFVKLGQKKIEKPVLGKTDFSKRVFGKTGFSKNRFFEKTGF